MCECVCFGREMMKMMVGVGKLECAYHIHTTYYLYFDVNDFSIFYIFLCLFIFCFFLTSCFAQ